MTMVMLMMTMTRVTMLLLLLMMMIMMMMKMMAICKMIAMTSFVYPTDIFSEPSVKAGVGTQSASIFLLLSCALASALLLLVKSA